MEMQVLNSKVGELIVTSAVLDDVIGIIILSFTLGQGNPYTLGAKMCIFFASFMILLFLIHKIGKVKLHIPRFGLTVAIAFAFIFSALAKGLGLATIVGAFFAGLVLSNLPQRRRMIGFTRQIGNIFFIPLFFVWVGASFDFHAIEDLGVLVLLFIPMALAGKLIGCSLGAKISKFKGRDALAVGIGMMPRMEIALVIVSTEVAREIFAEPLAHQIMAGTILLVIVSSLLTPVLLKMVYRKEGKQ
jgi:Kef-type K+ transport system membrane component KefB